MPHVGGVFVPRNPAFEAMHPRDKSGRDRGQFIDVPGVMSGLGAVFDHEQGVWNIPVDRHDDLRAASKEMGFEMMSVPSGMRPLRSRGALASATDPETGLPDPKIAQDAALEKKLAIPPAWTDVMVSNDPNADVLAVGRDAKGRKQSMRSASATNRASADKFVRVTKLHDRMPAVDHQLSQDASTDDTAGAMMLVRRMGLRPGGTKNTGAEQFAYGASTLERRHVRIEGDTVHLEFDSKKSGHTVLERQDAELASVLQARVAGKGGGDQLFPDTNERKMNRWVDETAGEEFSVKDFRTYLGTREAAAMVADMPAPLTVKEHRQMQLKVGDHVSRILGNTRAESLKSYINPDVFGPKPGDDADLSAPEIPGKTARTMLAAAFEAGFTEHGELRGAQEALSVKRVTLSDGTQAVLKRPQPDQLRREVVSGLLASALGFDSVHTVGVGDGQVLSPLIPGSPGTAATASPMSPGAREMAVLDWLTRNRDRADGNWIANGDGVHPINHGKTNFGPEGNDRDIPRGPFAQYWLGLTQKPTPRAAAGKTLAEARNVKGPKAKLDPKLSKKYLRDIKPSLAEARPGMTDQEWAGVRERFNLLYAAAPTLVAGEEPFKLAPGLPEARPLGPTAFQPSRPGNRHSVPPTAPVDGSVEPYWASADVSLRDAGVDLSSGFARPHAPVESLGDGNSNGNFSPSTGTVRVDPKGSTPIITSLHELGHKIDWEIYEGDNGRYGSERGGEMGPDWDPHKEMRKAVERMTAEGWQYAGKRGAWAVMRKDGEEVRLNWAGNPLPKSTTSFDDPIDPTAVIPHAPAPSFMGAAKETETWRVLSTHPRAKEHFGKYLLQPRELFARAFSQYIASRSTDPDTQDQLQIDLGRDTPPIGLTVEQWVRESDRNWPQQWPEEDFAPIAAFFDDLMQELGLKVPNAP